MAANLVAAVKAEQAKEADLLAMAAETLAALKLAYEAMNYLGDVLNGMGAVMPEDEEATTEAFMMVRAVLAKAEAQS